MRPKPALALTVFLGCAVVFAVSMFYTAPLLPERVATHFNASGQPNGWMTREQHLLFMAILSVGISAFAIGIGYSVRFFPPSALNAPNAAYWRSPEHYPKACALLLRWSLWLASLSLL